MPVFPEKFPGEGLLTKVWETLTEKGIGGLASPWQIRREGRARTDVRREELLMLAQAERDAEAIRAGRMSLDERGRLVALPPPETPKLLPGPEGSTPAAGGQTSDFIRATRDEAAARLIQEAVNLRRTILLAETESESVADAEVTDRPIDPDWFDQWRSHAETVSDDAMRRLWASVLAGEAKEPGKYSLRTLSFVRELSKPEADMIALAASFVIDGRIIYRHMGVLGEAGLAFEMLVDLQDLGIISGVEAVGGMNWQVTSNDPERFVGSFLSHGKGLRFERSTSSPPLQIPAFTLTRLGREVLTLGTFEPNDTYMRALGALIKTHGFSVKYGPIRAVGGGAIGWLTAEDL